MSFGEVDVIYDLQPGYIHEYSRYDRQLQAHMRSMACAGEAGDRDCIISRAFKPRGKIGGVSPNSNSSLLE